MGQVFPDSIRAGIDKGILKQQHALAISLGYYKKEINDTKSGMAVA
jgi:hypothetical protein